MKRILLSAACLTLGSVIAVEAVSCREENKRAEKINSFENVGGREVYRQQRLQWLRRQLGELHLVDPTLRDEQRHKLEEAIDAIDSDQTDELGGKDGQ